MGPGWGAGLAVTLGSVADEEARAHQVAVQGADGSEEAWYTGAVRSEGAGPQPAAGAGTVAGYGGNPSPGSPRR